MKFHGYDVTLGQIICLCVYKLFAQWLPSSTCPFVGKPSKWFRYVLCRRIFKFCGENVNVERKADFGCGFEVQIGDNSGIGVNCTVTPNIIIGNDVMMGPNCCVLPLNHKFDRTDISMMAQGSQELQKTVIGNDVWIGRDVLFTPGRTVADGTVVAARCVLCKDFPAYSIVGGNPARLIRSRK